MNPYFADRLVTNCCPICAADVTPSAIRTATINSARGEDLGEVSKLSLLVPIRRL